MSLGLEETGCIILCLTFLAFVEDGRARVIDTFLLRIREGLAAAFVYTFVCHLCARIDVILKMDLLFVISTFPMRNGRSSVEKHRNALGHITIRYSLGYPLQDILKDCLKC